MSLAMFSEYSKRVSVKQCRHKTFVGNFALEQFQLQFVQSQDNTRTHSAHDQRQMSSIAVPRACESNLPRCCQCCCPGGTRARRIEDWNMSGHVQYWIRSYTPLVLVLQVIQQRGNWSAFITATLSHVEKIWCCLRCHPTKPWNQ